MIKGILDTDLYKLTMQQAVCRLYPSAIVTYKVFNRGNHKLSNYQADRVSYEIERMKTLFLSDSEESYLRKIRYISPFYVDFLKGYKFNPDEVIFNHIPGGNWSLTVTGPWYRTILWETPILAILSQVISDIPESKLNTDDYLRRTITKRHRMLKNNVRFADFGTRRRASFHSQRETIAILSHEDSTLVGTSNVLIAKEIGIKPIGTHAHEWYMFHAAKYGYREANRRALNAWSYVYDGDLGIALPDTFGTPLFLSQFSMKYAKLFDGVRQDSGDPIKFAEKIISFYEGLGINPKHKTIVFSDGLNVSKAIELNDMFKDRINCSFGIGTYLTNDFDKPAPNIVMKMTMASDNQFKMRHTIKLSDSKGKFCGDEEEINACLQEYQKTVPKDFL